MRHFDGNRMNLHLLYHLSQTSNEFTLISVTLWPKSYDFEFVARFWQKLYEFILLWRRPQRTLFVASFSQKSYACKWLFTSLWQKSYEYIFVLRHSDGHRMNLNVLFYHSDRNRIHLHYCLSHSDRNRMNVHRFLFWDFSKKAIVWIYIVL